MMGGYVTRSREELKQRQKQEKKRSPPKAGAAKPSEEGKEKQKGHGR